jgi:aspartate 1-decarboxylase
MQRILCKSKIHRATITEANLHYEGSLTIDSDLMKAADIIAYEQVSVVNVNNGERFETYAITGKAGSGVICLNGAAARKGMIGDKVIIISYGVVDAIELPNFHPAIVHVDDHNHVTQRVTEKVEEC